MANKHEEHYECYEIRVKGYLNKRWANEFKITYTDEGDSILIGKIVDQAALYGVIKRFRDLGIALVSIQPIGKCKSD